MADMTLQEYIQKTSAEPFKWGESDCCLFPANWVFHRTGRDPVAAWRGMYSTSRGAYHFVRRAGGLISLCESSMSWFQRIEGVDAQSGDVGVVHGNFEVAAGQVWNIMAAAICVNNLWMVRSHRSLIGSSVPHINILAAWRIN